MIMAAAALLAASHAIQWKRLPDIPNPKGLAGLFAGVSHGVLLVGGGSNFPAKPPWEGGTKVWYSQVYALRPGGSHWTKAGSLPRKLAYGVSASYDNRVICAGGSDSSRIFPDVCSIAWQNGHIIVHRLPRLPVPTANGCGTIVGHTLYVVGGQSDSASTIASNRVFALDLSSARLRWKEIPPIPGPGRILATAASWGGSLWVCGGASLHADAKGQPARTYLRDCFRWNPKSGWKRVADLPYTEVAAPTPAPAVKGGFYILGGDDGSWAGKPQAEHPGFRRDVLFYDGRANRWIDTGKMPVGRVTAPTAAWDGRWIIANGERHPGVRSPQIWSGKF